MTTINSNTPAGFIPGNFGIQTEAPKKPEQAAGLGNAAGTSGKVPPAGSGGASSTSFIGKSGSEVNVPPGAEERLAAAKSMLESGGGGSITQMIGAIMIKMAAEQRQNALDNRTAAYEAQKVALDGQASEMREAADKMMSGAIMSLVLTVVAAAVSTVMSISSLNQQKNALGDMSKATDGVQQANKDLKTLGDVGSDAAKAAQKDALLLKKEGFDQSFKLAEAKSSIAQIEGQIVRTLSEAVQNSGNLGSKMLEAQSKVDDAEGQEKAAAATVAAQQGDFAKEIEQNMKEMMAAIITFLKDMQDAEVEQMRSITRA